MLRFCEKSKGAISVFLTLILLPTFIFGGVIIDGSRILGAKNLVSGAGDMALNGALSNYQEELNQTYGLLAMASTAEEVNSVMKDFFETTLNANGIAKEDFNKALVYLELTEDDFEASNVLGTEVWETEVLKQEILEYMKYRAPATLMERMVTDKLGELKNAEKERKAADAQLKFESELEDVQELFDRLKELSDTQKEIYKTIYTEMELDGMLSCSKSNYEKITWLSAAYYRMLHCSESGEGDVKSLMQQMINLSCDVGSITYSNASSIIYMVKVKNGMNGKNPEDILEGLDKKSEEYREAQQFIADYKAADSVREEGIANTGREIDELVGQTYAEMSEQRSLAVRGEINCKDIKEALEELRKEFQRLRGKYETWKEAVAELEGDSKKAYEKNIAEVSGFFEAEGLLGEFESKIENNEAHYKEVYEKLDTVTFTGYRLDKELSSKAVFLGEADYGAIWSPGEILSSGQNFMERYHDIGSMALAVLKRDISDDEFVKLLETKYCKNDARDKEKEKEETKKWGDDLTEYLKKLKNLMLTDDIEQLNVLEIGSGEIPTQWLNLGGDNREKGDTATLEGGLDSKKNRKKVTNGSSDNLNRDNASISEMSSLGDMLAEKGEAVAEPLMLTEYIFGMFSHYTSNKDADEDRGEDRGEVEKPLSITGNDLSKNALYRAEIEYILWGSPESRNNVGITKAIIFTANLVFNMGFAFTNSNIRTDATKVASFFPIGPLGQTAIKCALQAMVAMIETTQNMVDIMDGKSVPLLKKPSVWNTWIFVNPNGSSSHDSGTNSIGFTYEDYLWILVCGKLFIPSQQVGMLGRTADCIELNMTEKKSKEEKTLKDMYTMVEIEAAVSIDTFFIQKLHGAGYEVQNTDEETFKIQYYGVQGY